jgi:hypothetical protein
MRVLLWLMLEACCCDWLQGLDAEEVTAKLLQLAGSMRTLEVEVETVTFKVGVKRGGGCIGSARTNWLLLAAG